MEKCRKCNTEVETNKGRFQTAEGSICPSCVKKMGKIEWKKADVEAKEYASFVAKRELREVEEKAYRDAQTAIGRIMFPLSGPRRELSLKTLDKIITAMQVTDPDERTLRINNLVKAVSPKIESAVREGKSKKANTDDADDRTGLSVVGGQA